MQLQHPFGVITTSVDGRVLAVLARADAAFTTGQVHRVLPTVSQEGIRNSLNRLADQGVVLATRVGNAFTYRLNVEHLAAPYVQGIADLMSTLLGRLTDELDAWRPRPVYAALFGSAARGDMTPDSDIDLLLVRPSRAAGDRWDEQAEALAGRVSRWTGNDTRMLVLDESAVQSGELVLHDVLEHGLTVAGTHDWLARRLRPVPVSP